MPRGFDGCQVEPLEFLRLLRLPRIRILYRADHRQHVIIRRKVATSLVAGFDVRVEDQADQQQCESQLGHRHIRVSHLGWNQLNRAIWPLVRRLQSQTIHNLYWRLLLWLRFSSNAVWMAWMAVKAKADCYLAEDLQSAWAALLVARFCRRPVIYDAHEIEAEQGCGDAVRVQRGVLRSLERKLVARVDHLVVPSQARAAFYAGRYGAVKVYVAPSELELLRHCCLLSSIWPV
jgi:hypothetical protein